jgi:hypothetical protein
MSNKLYEDIYNAFLEVQKTMDIRTVSWFGQWKKAKKELKIQGKNFV